MEGKAKIAKVTPFGRLPVYEELDENGAVQFRLTQSLTIARHIARKHNLYGDTEQERSRADEWVDTAAEVMCVMSVSPFPCITGRPFPSSISR